MSFSRHIRRLAICGPILAALVGGAHGLSAAPAASDADVITVTMDAEAAGKRISPDLVGVFFEDLSYAADGGLYAELVQNRSFDYSSRDSRDWNSLTAWQLAQRHGGSGSVTVETELPLNAQNSSYAVLSVDVVGDGVGLINEGFDGIPVKAGETYPISLFARRLSGPAAPLNVRLESKNGALLAEAILPAPTSSWMKVSASLKPTTTDSNARLVVLANAPGKLALDMVSLFPEKTFHNRPNGLRADIAQTIADLKPKFMRFPGGCLVHGDGLDNIYHWKNTIGPIEQRKGQPNIWRYHQSVGLGYFEYFQFCEDIGAKPLPVVAAGVCCQNSDYLVTRQYGIGQKGLSMDQMPAYIQDVLDLIEWANGPITSVWGAKRAAAGHPEPFGLQYLGVGNEDNITPVFRERFEMIYKTLKEKHPEITVIGTVGPNPDDEHYEKGWKIANELRLPMVDEHCYKSPQWFWENLQRFDAYDRAKTKVYLGEWASFDDNRRSTLRSAMAEAAYLTSLERNADVVRFASYAPLLANLNHTHWSPNLIYFNHTNVFPTINYHVQQLFSLNNGDTYLPTRISTPRNAAAKHSLILGTWNTQAEFADIRISCGPDILLTETFDSAPAGWNAASGVWRSTGGSYRQTSPDQPALSRRELPQIGSAYTITLKARKLGGAEGVLIGFGKADPGDYYWWNLGGWGNSQHGVERGMNGARNLVGKPVSGNIESNRWYNIKIESDGSHIRFYLDGALIHDITGTMDSTDFAASSVKDSASGDLILKLVNGAGSPKPLRIELVGAKQLPATAKLIVLAGNDPMAINDSRSPRTVLPHTSSLPIAPVFHYEAPPNSLTVIRITGK
jgi:alpha-L-arabinofuranosidase